MIVSLAFAAIAPQSAAAAPHATRQTPSTSGRPADCLALPTAALLRPVWSYVTSYEDLRVLTATGLVTDPDQTLAYWVVAADGRFVPRLLT